METLRRSAQERERCVKEREVRDLVSEMERLNEMMTGGQKPRQTDEEGDRV